MLRCFGAKRSCHLNLGMLELEATQGQFGLTAEHRKQEHLESPAFPFLHLMLGQALQNSSASRHASSQLGTSQHQHPRSTGTVLTRGQLLPGNHLQWDHSTALWW